MYGAIIGDIIGSAYKSKTNITDFDINKVISKCHFTGDTVQIIATIDAMTNKKNYAETYKDWCKKYPTAGYGKKINDWIKKEDLKPINTFDNSSAVRAIPIGWKYNSLEETLKAAKESAIASHTHPFGINGAKAVAGLIYLARTGTDKQDMELWAEKYYNLDFLLSEIISTYKFDATCQGSVPQAIVAFLESKDFISCIKKATSLGGDSSSITAIACGLAEAYSISHESHKIPKELIRIVQDKCPEEFTAILKGVKGDYKFKKR